MPELPFLDRAEERRRLERLSRQSGGRLAVLYGRRRCGKSRLLLECLAPEQLTYFFCDQREPAVQRASLAGSLAAAVPGFDQVIYPEWDALLERWWREAPAGSILALDEFPHLVAASPALPSLLQKGLDRRPRAHLVLCGSSQRMMQGLVLDRTAPLYGRAQEILKISPLRAGWLGEAFPHLAPREQVEAFAVWGGVPRYWELASDFPTLEEAISDLILSPLGVLHDEPATLLQDDLADTVQSASLLQLIGSGCHRLTELASRLGKPPTSLNRGLQRLVELELIARDRPFAILEKDSKRSYYRITDPFLRFWYAQVAPRRSLLQSRHVATVLEQVRAGFSHHVASVWEDLVRSAIPHLEIAGRRWAPAARWWGPGRDRQPLELDAVSVSLDGSAWLLASSKWEGRARHDRALRELQRQAANFPLAEQGQIKLAVFGQSSAGQVLQALRS